MKTIRNDKGTILLMVLLLMLIVTLLGVLAIDTATVDVQITGNLKRSTTAFEGADAGIDLSIPIIERTMAEGTLTPNAVTIEGNAATLDSSLGTEIVAGSSSSEIAAWDRDMGIPSLGDVQIDVDIDRLYSDVNAGNAMEFASGYEGIGSGAAGGGVSVLFRITSQGTR